MQTNILLQKKYFSETHKVLADYKTLQARIFIFDSGVCALQIINSKGYATLLPYQGQQIWDLKFNDRTLTMKSMFKEPRPTTDFLKTYGGFFLHCGATAMGAPSDKDTHPPHGELPNAQYQTATLIVGEDSAGSYMALTGEYEYIEGFNHHYVARPLVKIYENSSELSISMEITNLKNTEMELMYLAHINFRPVDFGKLVYSALSKKEKIKVRRSIPIHIKPQKGYTDFLEELATEPNKHHILVPNLMFDPEVVFSIDYLTDARGWAHSLQIHPDGTSDYVSHRPEQLKHGIRWISRTADQDCLGIVLPATAETEGYSTEKKKGNVEILKSNQTFRCDFQVGLLGPERTLEVERTINTILI